MTRSLKGVRRGVGFVGTIVMGIFTGTAAVAQSGKAITLAVLPLENNSVMWRSRSGRDERSSLRSCLRQLTAIRRPLRRSARCRPAIIRLA